MLGFLGFSQNSDTIEDFISNFKKIDKISSKINNTNKKGKYKT